MTQFEVLYRLQEIDLGIHARQKRLEEVAQLLTNDSAVVEAQRRVTDINQVLTPLQTKSRNLELEIQTNASKIKITDETLYSGRVRNPKELQDPSDSSHNARAGSICRSSNSTMVADAARVPWWLTEQVERLAGGARRTHRSAPKVVAAGRSALTAG